MKTHLFLCLAASAILTACGGNPSSESAPSENEASEGEAVEEEVKGYDPAIAQSLPRLDSVHGYLPLYFTTEQGSVFLFCEEEWGDGYFDYFSSDPFPENHTGIGLLDESGVVLLSPDYDMIGNPGAIAEGWLEVEKQGQFGLVNYIDKRLVECRYEAIFPSSKLGVLAYGRSKEGYYRIETTGNAYPVDASDEVPSFLTQPDLWEIDVYAEGFKPLYHSYKKFWEEYPEGHLSYSFITPSYLYQLGVFPRVKWSVSAKGRSNGSIIHGQGKVKQGPTFGDRFLTFISTFYTQGIEGRDMVSGNQIVLTVDRDNRSAGHQTLLHHTPGFSFQESYCTYDSLGFEFLSDSLIRIRSHAGVNDGDFRQIMKYEFLEILETGEVKRLECNREFNFTKYVPLTEAYFKGCYTQYKSMGDGEYEHWVWDHLDLEAIDRMHHEILAEYGQRFTEEKWQQYFSEKDWYQAKHDDVKELLSPLDRSNLAFIAQMRQKVEANPDLVNRRQEEMEEPYL